jgi:hypothetical protein
VEVIISERTIERVPVCWAELEIAIMAANADQSARAWVYRDTGDVIMIGDSFDAVEPPADGDQKWVELPKAETIDLKHMLAMAFVRQCCPNLADAVERRFIQVGGWRKYKDPLERNGLIHAWHQFEEQATRKALLTWAAEKSPALIRG